ncbi:MAG: phage head closure protein, partial [Mesorhizobium sp.]|nr:phage head closure protein [Mesorhizobium sp.]
MAIVLIDPGTLRTELALEAMSPAPDGAGGHVEIWSEIGTVFANIEPVSARDRFGAAQTLEEVTHRITIRQR